MADVFDGLEEQLRAFAAGYPRWRLRLEDKGAPLGWTAEMRRPDIDKWWFAAHAGSPAEAVARSMQKALQAEQADED